MWPWEHAAIGYIAYSLLSRLREFRPSNGATLWLLLGTQLPDLIDKPLAWWFNILPGGRTLGHSLFFAIPVCVVVLVGLSYLDRREYGIAFVVGYALHLPADVISPMLFGGTPSFGFLFWPVVPANGSSGWEFGCEITVSGILECVFGPLGVVYLLAELVLLGTAAVLWIRDGHPGLVWPNWLSSYGRS